MKKRWLDGKTFIVTGATSGLGRGLSRTLIEKNGCTVIGIGRNAQKFDSLKNELGYNEEKLLPIIMDVTDKTAWQNFVIDLTARDIAPDGIINCAGILPPFKKAVNAELCEVEKVLNADFMSCVYAINALYPILSTKNSPAIINVSSSAALMSLVGTSCYSAAKSALKSYTESLIYEMKGKAYVSIVMPGFARTEIFRNQNTDIEGNKLIYKMSMPAQKMVNKIYRGICKKRTRMIFGKDAHAMNFFYRLCPKTAMSATAKILKKANIELFREVFCD